MTDFEQGDAMLRNVRLEPRPEGAGGRAAADNAVIVAVSGSGRSEQLVEEGQRLAEWLGAPWEAVHIETPSADRESTRGRKAADALALAASLGATIATLPAASVADGLQAHLGSSPAGHLILGGTGKAGGMRFWERSLLDVLAPGNPGLVLHVHTGAEAHEARTGGTAANPGPAASPRSYLYAAGLVAATLLLREVLQLFLGTRPLDLLFLFPVIAVAARLGLRPALLAVGLSVVCYNFFLLAPTYSFNPAAPQNLVMSGVLVAIAIYTSILTTRMRGRVVLSDRSARENASIAALAQKLARDADWETTALTICDHVTNLLKVQVAVYREKEGDLTVAGAIPPGPTLGPIDRAALDWVWANGEEAGSGTSVLPTADWQFQPLKTSLGTLAVLGLAQDDGRDPVRADQRMLLHTLVAQSALAHERLRLEDLMRTPSTQGGAEQQRPDSGA